MSFLVQDRVSPVSSRLWLMMLPAGLLSELAEISKLLVSRLQGGQLWVGQGSGSRFSCFRLQSSGLSGRVNVSDDGDRTDEDWDVSRTPRSEEVDLFDEGSSGQKTDPSDSICGPGERESLPALNAALA